jgi:hypothetical protein
MVSKIVLHAIAKVGSGSKKQQRVSLPDDRRLTLSPSADT